MDRIAKLTPEEAQRALLNLFDLLPDAWWRGGKPTPADIKYLAAEAPGHVAELESQDEAVRGEMAREILCRFAAIDAARPMVDQAIEESLRARLAPLPLLIVPMLMVLMGVKIEIGGISVQIGVPGSGADLARALAKLVKSLPGSVWASLGR